MMTTNKQPRGIDVARRAGVSKSAVSRAFTGGCVSDEARRRIFDAARELRYRPSQAARALKTNRSRLIGLAVTHLDNHFYPEVIERISQSLAESGSRLVLFITHGEAELEPMLDELLGYSLDGVILASGILAVELARECMEVSMPVIMFNNVDNDGMIPGVSSDNAVGAKCVAEHFIEMGHHKTAVISGVAESSTSNERADAFCAAMFDAGLPEPARLCGNYSQAGAVAAMEELLDMEERPTAVFCVNDHMALAALETCRRLGVEVGKDLAVAGFDDVGLSSWPSFELTSYAQPLQAMVDCCIDRLMNVIEGQQVDRGTVRLEGRLMIRNSSNFHIQEAD